MAALKSNDEAYPDSDPTSPELDARLVALHARLRTLRDRSEEQIEQGAGSYYKSISDDPSKARELLIHSNADVRWAALQLVSRHSGLTEPFADLCELLIGSDPDGRVRRAAMGDLGVYYKGSNNLRIAALLAGVVSDDSEDVLTRKRAYHSLARVAGRMGEDLPSWLTMQFPEDLDWSLVGRFLSD